MIASFKPWKERYFHLEDKWIRIVWEKSKFFTIFESGEGTWVLTLRALQTSQVWWIEHILHIGGESPEVPKLIWVVDLRMPGNYPDCRIYDIVSPTLTTSGSQSFGNTKTPEVSKLMWIMNLRILWDPSRLFDRGDTCITLRSCGGPCVEWHHCQVFLFEWHNNGT